MRFELTARDVVAVGDLPRPPGAQALPATLSHGLDTPLAWSLTGGQELSGGPGRSSRWAAA